ncbi:MAG: 3-dehydroquinate synthase, partial [Chitinophagaceae bacterium]
MEFLQQSFTVSFQYKVFFTEHLFATDNTTLADFLATGAQEGLIKKLLFVVDEEVARKHPQLKNDIAAYTSSLPSYALAGIIEVAGGEEAKNSDAYFQEVLDAINRCGIDRHSYVLAIGGGAVLDMVGYASAVAHRGVRHIRIPTTVLSQNDSGVGVKCAING